MLGIDSPDGGGDGVVAGGGVTLAAGIDASAAVVNGIVGVGQPPRDNLDGDGDGEAIGDASRDHSNTLAADIMIGRIAYILPFSGVIAGVPIPV